MKDDEGPTAEPFGNKTPSTKSASTPKMKTLGEVSMNVSPSASPKSTSTSSRKPLVSKGTPGAGKLLKKHTVSSAMPPPPLPTTAKSASKLAAIAELAGDAKAAK